MISTVLGIASNNVYDYGLAGVAIVTVGGILYKMFDWLKSRSANDQQASANTYSDAMVVAINNNTDAMKNMSSLVQSNTAALNLSINGQTAMMEILKSIKAHCDQETSWWMEMMKGKGG